MSQDYAKIARAIVDGVGGQTNIAGVTHCMTRLRFVLGDMDLADDEAVRAVSGVKSVARQSGEYQVIIGNEVSHVFDAMVSEGLAGAHAAVSEAPEQKETNPVKRVFGFIAGCITPLLPAMLGTGMVKVLLTLLTTLGVLATDSAAYILLYGMADSFFYFMPIFLGYMIAKKTGHSVPLYMVIGAMFLYPTVTALLGGEAEGIATGTFFGINCVYLFGVVPVVMTSYASSLLPMFLMTPIMGWVEDFADRVSPDVVKAFLKPMIFLLICAPIAFIIIGPIGSVCGSVLAAGMAWLYSAVPWLTVGLLSALMPFIVMTGMHYALIPLMTLNLSTVGYDVIVIVTMFCSNLCQGGAAFGVAAKTKNTELRSEGIASGISAIVAGVTEPAMYGINLRFLKPMIAAVAGAAVSGLLAGITGVRAYTAGGSPSLLSLITFVGGEGDPFHGVIWGAICAAVGIAIAFALAYFLYRDEDNAELSEPEAPEAVRAKAVKAEADHAAGLHADCEAPLPEADQSSVPDEAPGAEDGLTVTAPMSGRYVALADVPDEAFACGALGEGAALYPEDGCVYAPFDGEVTALMETGHAIGLTSDAGINLLIHVGMNTVELAPGSFIYLVKEGARFHRGDLLMTADLVSVAKQGFDLTTPVVVLNADEFGGVRAAAADPVKPGELFLTVEKKAEGE